MITKSPECWASDPQARGLRIEVSPERSLLLPFDQFILAELTTDGKEQRLWLVFATYEVLVRGYTLRRIETAMQRLELSHLARVPDGLHSAMVDNQPIIREIVVMEAKAPEGHSG